MGKESGFLICTHHFNRPALANQNGRPDLSQRPAEAHSARIGRSPSQQEDPPPESEREMVAPLAVASTDQNVLPSDCPSEDTPAAAAQSDTLIIEEEETSVPPNPFGDSEEEEEEEEEAKNEEKEEEKEIQTPAKETSNDDTPPISVGHLGGVARPVPAPRRVPEATPPPRPAPRARPQPTPERQLVKGV